MESERFSKSSLNFCLLCRYKDDIEIFEEDGYEFEIQDSNACLKLQDVDAEDAGSYTVEIENAAGVLSKTFTLDLKGNFPLIKNLASLLPEARFEYSLLHLLQLLLETGPMQDPEVLESA